MIIIKKRNALLVVTLFFFAILMSGAVMMFSEASCGNRELCVIVDAGHEGYELCFNK